MTDKLGAAETATADAMRMVRETQREKENIVVQVVKAVEKAPSGKSTFAVDRLR